MATRTAKAVRFLYEVNDEKILSLSFCYEKNGVEYYIKSYDIQKDTPDILWFIRNNFDCRLVDIVYEEAENGKEN